MDQSYSYVCERYRGREYIYLDRTRVILFKMALDQNQENSVKLVKNFWAQTGVQRSQDGERDARRNGEKRLFKHLETNLLEILQGKESERLGELSLSKFLTVRRSTEGRVLRRMLTFLFSFEGREIDGI